jgi:hypothetical protein
MEWNAVTQWLQVSHGGFDPWRTPLCRCALGALVNCSANETRASLSWDGATMVFGPGRPESELSRTGTPSTDVYVTTREKLTSKKVE